MGGFMYNGIHSSNKGIYRVTDIRRSILPPITSRLLTVPSRAGAYYQGHEYGVRQIEVDIVLKESTPAILRERVRALAAWLKPGGQPKDLVFDDEPNLTWRAVLSGDTDLEEIVSVGKGTLTFLCPDPVALGPETTVSLGTSGGTVTPGGTAPAWPVIKATVQQPITHLAVATPDRHVLLGRPEGVEEAPTPREELVLHDPMSSLTGWGQASSSEIVNGTVSGSMTTDSNAFYPADYGSGSGWHGPGLKKGLPEPLQDFRVDTLVIQDPRSGQTGRAEVYLLDPNGVIVAMISVRDRWAGSKSIEVRALVGNSGTRKDIHVGQADRPQDWVPFQGVMRLQRIGQVWAAYWALLDSTGRHHTRRYVELFDKDNAFQLQVAQVLVWISKYADTQPTTQSITDIKVWRINTLTSTQVPYIADPGDVLEIDCERFAVYKNGEPCMDLLDPGSQFFSLTPGQPVTIGVEPAGAASVELTYRERWL